MGEKASGREIRDELLEEMYGIESAAENDKEDA